MSEETEGIGLVGCGAIGTEIAGAITRGEVGPELIGIWDIDSAAAEKLASSLTPRPGVV